MPIIMVYGIGDIAQERMSSFIVGLRQATASVKELGIDPLQVTCFLPEDKFLPHRGKEIVIFVDGLFAKPERTAEVRKQLAEKLVAVVFEYLDDINLAECFIRPFNHDDGFASHREK